VNPEVLIIGCGFLGEAAAELFSTQGRQVLGLVRGNVSLEPLAGKPYETALCDVTDPASVEGLTNRLREVPLAIYAVSSGRGGAESYAAVYRDGLKRILDHWKPSRLLFVSSTSVYAQTDGDWVTEDSPTIPDRETGRILLEAEQISLGAGGSVARLSGIYGPGRSVLLRKFLMGESVLEEGGGRWINQIHRDDAAAALVRLGDPIVPPGLYNTTDDFPASQREVYCWMSDFLGKPLPPEGPADRNRKRGWTSKRVSNRKLHEIGWKPSFPSFRDALPRLLPTISTII
jgi:nucleoside-diphosphate-sugar epimerase